MDTIRVLQINAGSRNFGGVSAMLFNIYKNIDKEHIQFDFLTPNISTYEQHRNEIEAMGGRIYQFHINSSTFIGKLKLKAVLRRFLKEHKYDVIHINSGVLLFNCIVAETCKKHSNARIFVHSHNNGGRDKKKESLSMPFKYYLASIADVKLACSRGAAYYMFSPKDADSAIIINNGINVNKFSFNQEIRDLMRKELMVGDKFVIGNVGRFMIQKNHKFIIDVFHEFVKIRPDSILMLIGQGELEETIKEKVKKSGIDDRVIFMGQRSDISNLYQVMDVFFLPSLYEGFPVTVVEAQASGLPCVVSEAVPQEADIVGNVIRLSLKDNLKQWCNALNISEKRNRNQAYKAITDKGFDIQETAKIIAELYR